MRKKVCPPKWLVWILLVVGTEAFGLRTFLTAAAYVCFKTLWATQKQFIAVHIGAVVVALIFFSTVVAGANHRCVFTV